MMNIMIQHRQQIYDQWSSSFFAFDIRIWMLKNKDYDILTSFRPNPNCFWMRLAYESQIQQVPFQLEFLNIFIVIFMLITLQCTALHWWWSYVSWSFINRIFMIKIISTSMASIAIISMIMIMMIIIIKITNMIIIKINMIIIITWSDLLPHSLCLPHKASPPNNHPHQKSDQNLIKTSSKSDHILVGQSASPPTWWWCLQPWRDDHTPWTHYNHDNHPEISDKGCDPILGKVKRYWQTKIHSLLRIQAFKIKNIIYIRLT